jgi:phage-related tail protein
VTEPNVSASVGELVASLESETALYEKLAEGARQIASAVREGDYDALEALLKNKDRVIGELRSAAERTDRLRNNPDRGEKVPQGMQAKAAEAFDRARRALEALVDLEQQNEAMFRTMTDSIRAELAEMAGGRRLLDGYRLGGQTGPLFMDKRR